MVHVIFYMLGIQLKVKVYIFKKIKLLFANISNVLQWIVQLQ